MQLLRGLDADKVAVVLFLLVVRTRKERFERKHARLRRLYLPDERGGPDEDVEGRELAHRDWVLALEKHGRVS